MIGLTEVNCMNCILTNIVFQTVADEKRVVDEQRRTLDEEIADFQRRKVGGFPLSLLLQSIVNNYSIVIKYVTGTN